MTEMIIVSILMSLLSVLIGNIWLSLGKAAWEIVHRSRITEEAEMAAATLGTDLAGYYPDASPSGSARDRFRQVGRIVAPGGPLMVCFDGDDEPDGLASWAAPDRVLSYYAINGSLIREDVTAGRVTVVARHVTGFAVTDLGTAVRIDVDFGSRGFTSSYRFIAQDPP